MNTEDAEELALELRAIVSWPLTSANVYKRPRLISLVSPPSDTSSSKVVSAVEARLSSDIWKLGEVQLQRYRDKFEFEQVRMAVIALLSLDRSSKATAKARRVHALGILNVRPDIEAWRRLNGPEHELMRILARTLLQSTVGSNMGGVQREDMTVYLYPDGNLKRSSHRMVVFATRDGFSSIGPLGRLALADWQPTADGDVKVAITCHTPGASIAFVNLRKFYLHFKPLSKGERLLIEWDVDGYQPFAETPDGGRIDSGTLPNNGLMTFRYPLAVSNVHIRLVLGEYLKKRVKYFGDTANGKPSVHKVPVSDGVAAHEFRDLRPTYRYGITW